MNIFKRLLNWFRKKDQEVVVVQAPPQQQTIMDSNFERWKEYMETVKKTGTLPTTEAAPRTTGIPDAMVGSTRTYEEYLKDKYGQVPVMGRDLTQEEMLATATKTDYSRLPNPPFFKFDSAIDAALKFNKLADESMQSAYSYLCRNAWNELGTLFWEQASMQGFTKETIHHIVNTYSGGGGGVYFKP